MQFLVDDPSLALRTPGDELAIAVARAAGGEAEVALSGPVTTHFPLAPSRPRPTVRAQLKVATVTAPPLRYVREDPRDGDCRAGQRYEATPEAGFHAHLATADLTDLAVSVAVPGEICADPVMLARFVDHRVIVRLCTAENDLLLHGSLDGVITGLLCLPGLRRLEHGEARLLPALVAAAAEVEEMGGSCDGAIMHPRDYWQLVGERALQGLHEAGLRVTRTRMIRPGEILLGDFRAGVTLLDGPTSTLAMRRSGDMAHVEARMRLGLATQLPQHFVLSCCLPSRAGNYG